jgi:ABC-2 type transport system permease protein
MTTTTNSAKSATSRNGHPQASLAVMPKVTQIRVLRSEWIKIRSVRSTVWALVAMAVALIGGAAFAAVGVVVKDSPPAATAVVIDPSGGTLSGTGLAQLAVIVLGVVAVTGEYRTRMIRSSVAAVPTRLPLVWGKAAVVAASAAVASVAALLLSFLVASMVVATEGLSISLITPGVPRAMAGAALALGVTGALATGFGWLLRNTAAAVFLLLAVFYVVPTLATLLPPPVGEKVMPFLPSNAVAAVTQVAPVEGALPPGTGLAAYAGYAVITLLAAALVLRRRDA